jgi:hypothetical protein
MDSLAAPAIHRAGLEESPKCEVRSPEFSRRDRLWAGGEEQNLCESQPPNAAQRTAPEALS